MSEQRTRDEIKQRVREASDIVEIIGEVVPLRRAGNNFVGMCPFHPDRKTPSFSVSHERQFFHCFGCGESGDVFSFLMKYHQMSFPEALEQLARRSHIELPALGGAGRGEVDPRPRLYAVNEQAALLYQHCLLETREGQPGRDYLARRGVPPEAIRRYRLGYAPAQDVVGWQYLISRLARQGMNERELEQAGLAARRDEGRAYDRFRERLLFPIFDLSGRVCGFGGRILGEGQPKYMNSPETPVFDKGRLLLGLVQHRDEIRQRRQAVVVEGNFDMLSLAVAGMDYVVAPLGTALTRQQLRLLKGLVDEVLLFFDGDAAGLKAAMRAVPLVLAERLKARVAILPSGDDPDSLVRREGRGAVEALLDAARPLADFVLAALEQQHGLSLEGKARIVAELKPIINEAQDEAERELMISHWAAGLGIDPGQFSAALRPNVPPPLLPTPAASGSAPETMPQDRRQMLDHLVLYPEHLEELCLAGALEFLTLPAAREVVEALRVLAAVGPPQPHQLLETLPDGAARRYVARLLLAAVPVDVAESAGDEAPLRLQAMLGRLGRMRREQQARELVERITAAERAGDQAEVLALLARKQQLDRGSGG
ncbi:MAG: DNA primase [Desulfobulbaceae bacterium A2]|nr:MAG: DNA primase [Desulfobulbaceae bacterium A2]